MQYRLMSKALVVYFLLSGLHLGAMENPILRQYILAWFLRHDLGIPANREFFEQQHPRIEQVPQFRNFQIQVEGDRDQQQVQNIRNDLFQNNNNNKKKYNQKYFPTNNNRKDRSKHAQLNKRVQQYQGRDNRSTRRSK